MVVPLASFVSSKLPLMNISLETHPFDYSRASPKQRRRSMSSWACGFNLSQIKNRSPYQPIGGSILGGDGNTPNLQKTPSVFGFGGSLKWGYPYIIHFRLGFSHRNHPAIGVTHIYGKPHLRIYVFHPGVPDANTTPARNATVQRPSVCSDGHARS